MERDYYVDMDTPHLVEDFRRLIHVVDSFGDRIACNGLYGHIKMGIEEGRYTEHTIYRPGFHFCFWFETPDEAKSFAEQTGLYKVPSAAVFKCHTEDKRPMDNLSQLAIYNNRRFGIWPQHYTEAQIAELTDLAQL